MTKILLVEDDRDIIRNLSEYLKSEGFLIDFASTQNDAIEKISQNSFELILLDISLSQGNGFAVCAFAKENTDIPVIFLTASADEYSTVTGLDMGADDYIGKPFRPRELLSRIKNVLRRSGKMNAVIEFKDIKIDTTKAVVLKNNNEIFLSALEYRLFLVFMNNKGITLTRSKLLEEIWDIAGEFVNDNTLTVYIKRLRDKIEDDVQNPLIIKTVRGIGYRVGD